MELFTPREHAEQLERSLRKVAINFIERLPKHEPNIGRTEQREVVRLYNAKNPDSKIRMNEISRRK